MNETRTINLSGLVYHIDYDAYQLLREYLQDIEQRLPQEDRQEVMADIEARIAELLQKALFAKNVQVVNYQIVQSVKTQIGDPKEFGPNRRPKVKVDKSENAGCGRVVSITMKVILVLLALPTIFVVGVIFFSLVVTLFAMNTALGASFTALLGGVGMGLMEGEMYMVPLAILSAVALVIIPIVMIVHSIIIYMRTRRGPKARFWWITIILWLLSLVSLTTLGIRIFHHIDHSSSMLHAMVFDDMDIDEAGATTTMLQLDAYHSVELRGAAELHLSQADVASTTLTTNMLHSLVTGEDNWQTVVRDSVLYIDVTTQMPLDEVMLDFAIASPYLRKVTVYGASKIETADGQALTQPTLTLDLNGAAQADLVLHVQTLTIDAKGASQLELEGTADDVHVTIAGAGELEAEDLVAQTVHINCAGASKAEVNVARELWAQAAGASKITYKGTPHIQQNIAVGGSVIRRD